MQIVHKATSFKASLRAFAARQRPFDITTLLVIPLAAVLSGCGVEPDALEGADVTQTQSSLTTIYSGTVEQPWTAALDIGPTFNSACFLTGIGGRFEGGAEWGRVAKESGRWIVRAESQQVCDITSQSRCPLHVSASCIPVPYSAQGSWSKGLAETFLQNGGSCFLTRVMGKFVGGGESVLVYQRSNGDWYIRGTSQTNQSIGASAACVPNAISNGPVTKWLAHSWQVRLSFDPLPTERACYLQGVQGGMRSGSEKVAITRPTSSTSYFHLNGTSNASSANFLIGATGSCIGD